MSTYLVELNGVSLEPSDYRNPEGEALSLLVQPGDTIKTSYGTGGVVKSVTCFKGRVYGGLRAPDHYTICYISNADRVCHINDLVAVNGQILKLMIGCPDEVFIEKKSAQPLLPLLF